MSVFEEEKSHAVQDIEHLNIKMGTESTNPVLNFTMRQIKEKIIPKITIVTESTNSVLNCTLRQICFYYWYIFLCFTTGIYSCVYYWYLFLFSK